MQNSKQFLIDRILDQGRREGVSLSDIEIRMLKFTEATLGSKDREAAEAFERDYDDEEYERKIANLIRHGYERDKRDGKQNAWDDALARVAGRDLYLNIMIDRAGLGVDPLSSLKDWRFLLYGLSPPAFCLAGAILIGFSPIAARFIHSDLLRFVIAICFLAAPWLFLRRSKRRRSLIRKPMGR